ncbi:AglZ/HisF2 family acetamidino modification protein [Gammaproteobacteria bacterium]|nr:AglZ/HisF2 family acetamidino modification protein [Gammaproteobacteria bacterium]
MLRPRIIPSLLVHKGGLVKTINFKNPKYVGDPLNAVRIFNEKVVDELIVVDIDASVLGKEPDYKLIGELASECRMPLCFGGGVQTPEQVEKIISLGVEKVAIGSAAIENSQLIESSAERVGNQSIVVVMDVKRTGILTKNYELFIHNGKKSTGLNAGDFAKRMESIGAGEILINNIDRDGILSGYDMDLISEVRQKVNIPITALGGAGRLADISEIFKEFGIIGASAGSIFVFKGKYRAVLIQYPSEIEKNELLNARS